MAYFSLWWGSSDFHRRHEIAFALLAERRRRRRRNLQGPEGGGIQMALNDLELISMMMMMMESASGLDESGVGRRAGRLGRVFGQYQATLINDH